MGKAQAPGTARLYSLHTLVFSIFLYCFVSFVEILRAYWKSERVKHYNIILGALERLGFSFFKEVADKQLEPWAPLVRKGGN